MESTSRKTPQGRTELHFHLLAGVDDGPERLDESVELARMAVERDDTATIVATPHVRGDQLTDIGELPARIAEVEAALAAVGLDVRVRRGGELGHDMVGRLSQGELGSIALGPPTGRWLLLEAPFDADAGPAFHAAAEELRDRGFGVLIGHPERCPALLHHEQAGLRRELEHGALAQVNASSLTGAHGAAAAADGLRLIEQGLAVVVASDAHGERRPPRLSAACTRLVSSGVEPRTALRVTGSAPRALLARGFGTPQRAPASYA